MLVCDIFAVIVFFTLIECCQKKIENYELFQKLQIK